MEINTIKKKDTIKAVNLPLDKILPKVRVMHEELSDKDKKLQEDWLRKNKIKTKENI